MMLQLGGVVATGSAALDSGIGDTALETINGETYLYSLTGQGGGIVVWHLVEGAVPQQQDIEYFSGTISGTVGRSGEMVSLLGGDHIVLDVRSAAGLVSYEILPDGSIGELQETGTLSGGGGYSALVQVSFGSVDILAVAQEGSGLISTYTVGSDGSLTFAGAVAGQADSIQTAQSGSDQFVVATDDTSNSITTYLVDSSAATLSLADSGDGVSTLGIGAPTAVEIVQVHGHSWVIVAGSESNTISVMELSGDGRLIPTDHVLDTLNTRFESAQDLAVVEVNGQVFVVAGGGDDGVTLFTLTPDGQLVYLDSFADTLSTGLQNVESLSVAHVGDEIQIFAASQEEAGLTQLTFSVADLGIAADGYGTVTGTAQNDMLSGSILDATLLGGGGDDILIAGIGATMMTGGSGSDIFVMQTGTAMTTITDFEVGSDRLDLFDYPFLRSPGQLTFTSTAQGAQIEYLDNVVQVFSASGAPLTSSDVFGAGFGGPDHIPLDLNGLGGLDPDSSAGIQGNITIDSQAANPGLSNAEIRFTPDGGGTVNVQADDEGRFDLDLPSGTFIGELDIIKSYSAGTGEITALDALQVLRLSVGLDPTWGQAAPEDLIAADINQDGLINALDALAILQIAVGLPTAHEAEWVFLDADADLSGITSSNVTYETGVDVVAVDGVITTDMTSILLGNLEAV